jgi:hypothetical protein
VSDLKRAEVGDRVSFEGERMPYTIQARDERFIICTKPFAPRKTVIYCIVDLVEQVRGPDNLIFGMGYETRQDCEDRLRDLNSPEFPVEVSYRRRVPLNVTKVVSMPCVLGHCRTGKIYPDEKVITNWDEINPK